MAGIDVSFRSVKKAWRDGDCSEFWLELRVDRDLLDDRDVEDAFDTALEEVNDLFAPESGPYSQLSTTSPHGYVTFCSGVHDDDHLDRWLTTLAEHFEHHGLRGTIRGTPSPQLPSWYRTIKINPDQTLSSLPPIPTAFIAWTIDLDPQISDHSRRGRWLVDPDATDRICRHVAAWVEPGGPTIQLRRSTFTFVVTGGEIVAEVLASAVRDTAMAGVFRYHTKRAQGRKASFYSEGDTVLQNDDPDDTWEQRIAHLRDAITALPELTNQACIRAACRSATTWMDLALGQPLPEEIHEVVFRSNKHLLASYVPDVNGIQVLTDAHLARAHDLTRWNITDLGAGRHLVEAPDLTPWYSTALPDPDTVTRARADFGDMILTQATITANPPPWKR